jgi:hypothetical protein
MKQGHGFFCVANGATEEHNSARLATDQSSTFHIGTENKESAFDFALCFQTYSSIKDCHGCLLENP